MKTDNLSGIIGGSGNNSFGCNSSSGTETNHNLSSSEDVDMSSSPTGGGGGGDGDNNSRRKKKNWSELREDVRSLRRKLWGLGFRLPHSFTFRKMAGKTRIYFMASPPNSRDNSIFAVDVPNAVPQGTNIPFNNCKTLANKFQWIQILTSGFPVSYLFS